MHKGRPGAKPGGLWDELPARAGSIHPCATNKLGYAAVPAIPSAIGPRQRFV